MNGIDTVRILVDYVSMRRKLAGCTIWTGHDIIQSIQVFTIRMIDLSALCKGLLGVFAGPQASSPDERPSYPTFGGYELRVLGLLFSLIVLAVFVPVLLLAIGIHDFSWKAVLLFLVPAAIIYLIVRAVGISLDRQFNSCVKDFIDGKAAELVCGKGLKRIFGLLLITLLPFLVYLELYALVLAISFTVHGLWLLSVIERVPIAVILGLILVALISAYAILLGFFYLLFPPTPKSRGIAIGTENPGVWEGGQRGSQRK